MMSFKKIIEAEWFTFFSTPALLWQSLFVLLPLSIVLIFSLLDFSSNSITLTLAHYKAICTTTHIWAILNSLLFSALTTAACIVIAYPVAYYIAFCIKQFKLFLLLLLIMPSWTNIATQVYAWFVLLQKNGLISSLLKMLYITKDSMHLLNNKPVIIVGLTYCFLPFMILPLYLSLSSIKKNLLEASADLGATNFETFYRVILPLSKGGLINGILLVSVPTFGEYAVIEILGGANYALWGNNIVNTYLVASNYAQGAALTVAGITAFLLSILLCIITYKLIRYIKNYKPTMHVLAPEREGEY
ncbi:ABC transporter permease [Candidatus Dependentiae bacterium]|nr:ABC transporter permease [Candidatus Dependentiae bacterium]